MDAQELIFENHYRPPSLRRALRLPDPVTIAAASGFLAALIHAVVTKEHLAHWWGYGVFFGALAVGQTVSAVLIVRRPGRRLFLAVVASNVAVLALYVLSRALGTSFIGPHAGHPEPIGYIDLAAAAAEVAQILVLVTMVRDADARSVRVTHASRWFVAALLAVAVAGVAAPVGAVHATPPVDVLAASPEQPLTDWHQLHEEELIPTPPPALEEEAIAEEPAESCTPVADDAVGVPPKGANGEARAIVYARDDDLYIAAPPGGDVRRLTKGDCFERAPAFKDAETVSFQVDSRIYDLDLRTGKLLQIVEVEGGVAAFAWDAEGTTLAYLTWGSASRGPTLLAFTPATGQTSVLRSFNGDGGRCGSMDDEISIRWSPDGRAVLIVATFFDFSGETLFGVDLNGKDLIAPRLGTHALWGPNNTVIYREFNDARRWFSLDLDTGHSTRLAMESGTHHAAISPDGRRIAYSNEAKTPALLMYDLVTKTERAITTGYAVPLWLSPSEIAATKTKSCTLEECGGHGEWTTADATAVFNLSGTRVTSLSLRSTLDAAALIDPPTESEPSPAPSMSPTPTPTPTTSPSPEPSALPTSSPEPSPSPTPSATT